MDEKQRNVMKEVEKRSKRRRMALEEEAYTCLLCQIGLSMDDILEHVERFIEDPGYMILVPEEELEVKVEMLYLSKWRKLRRPFQSISLEDE